MNRLHAFAMGGLFLLVIASGCHQRIAVDAYPPNALKVRYVAATDYTDCLLAGTVMCANYIVGQDRFAAPRVRAQMGSAGLDMTRVGDVRAFFADRDIKLIPLKGNVENKPPLGLFWWVVSRGYPVICVVNQEEGAPEDFNHAVVVIGADVDDNTKAVGEIIILDPASAKRLERWDREKFLSGWQATGRVMLLMFDTSTEPQVVSASDRTHRDRY